MVQPTSQMIKGTKPNSPPSKSSDEDGEGFMSRNVRRGFRLAKFAVNSEIVGANLTMALSDAFVDLTAALHQSSDEKQHNPEVISVGSSPPQTVNSSSSNVEEVPPLVRTNIIIIFIKANRHINTSTVKPSKQR